MFVISLSLVQNTLTEYSAMTKVTAKFMPPYPDRPPKRTTSGNMQSVKNPSTN